MADRRRPTFGTARRKPAGQDMGLNVSKVASISPTGAPGIGHQLTVATGGFLASRLVGFALEAHTSIYAA